MKHPTIESIPVREHGRYSVPPVVGYKYRIRSTVRDFGVESSKVYSSDSAALKAAHRFINNLKSHWA